MAPRGVGCDGAASAPARVGVDTDPGRTDAHRDRNRTRSHARVRRERPLKTRRSPSTDVFTGQRDIAPSSAHVSARLGTRNSELTSQPTVEFRADGTGQERTEQAGIQRHRPQSSGTGPERMEQAGIRWNRRESSGTGRERTRNELDDTLAGRIN